MENGVSKVLDSYMMTCTKGIELKCAFGSYTNVGQ